MLVALIVGAEVAFWVLLGLGLLARYGLRMPRLGGALLLAVPLVDLVLLTAAFLDLRRGGEAGLAHTLSAVYLGVSAGYGHQIIKRMDARAAHRFTGAPKFVKPAEGSAERLRYDAGQYARHVVAWMVGSGLLVFGIWYVGDIERTQSLLHTASLWTLVLVVDGVWTSYDMVDNLRKRRNGPVPSAEEGVSEIREAARKR